jgi:hypothetical protein
MKGDTEEREGGRERENALQQASKHSREMEREREEERDKERKMEREKEGARERERRDFVVGVKWREAVRPLLRKVHTYTACAHTLMHVGMHT